MNWIKNFSEQSHMNFADGKKFKSQKSVRYREAVFKWNLGFLAEERAIESSKSSKTILVPHVKF